MLGSHVPGSQVPRPRVPVPKFQDPKSQGPRVSGLRVPGLRVPGLRSQGPGSQVLILDYADLCLTLAGKCIKEFIQKFKRNLDRYNLEILTKQHVSL